MSTALLLTPQFSRAQTPDANAALSAPSILNSVVEVESHGIKGHGVVLTDSGLILTSFRLVAGGIDLKVRLSPLAGGGEVTDVEILKVHPKYDLALLQGKAPFGSRFAAAPVVPKGGNAVAGLPCRVVTLPVKDAPPADAVHKAVVTSPEHQLDGLSYVQISLGEDFTGAPVCDEKGRVFALVTRSLDQSGDIGLAISTQKLAISDFVPVKERPINKDLAVRASQASVLADRLARSSSGAQKQHHSIKSVEYTRYILMAEPSEPLPYNNMGLSWEELGEPLIGRRWFEAGLKVAPTDAELLHSIGVNLMTIEPKDQARAVEYWRSGMTAPPDKEAVEICANDLAIYAFNQRRPAAAAYMLRWGFTICVKTGRSGPPGDDELRQAVGERLPQPEVAVIRNHDGPFSIAVYDELLQGKSFAEAVKKTMLTVVPATPAIAAASSSVKVRLPTKEDIQRMEAAHAGIFQPAMVPVPPGGTEFPLPSGFRQIIPASSGWQALVVFTDFGKIGAFNLAKGKFDGFIDCPDPSAMCASGGKLVAIYSPATGLLELHDLTTFQKISSQPLVVKGKVKFIGMGLHNASQLFVVYDELIPEMRGSGVYRPALVQIPEMSVSYPPVQQRLGGAQEFYSHAKAELEGAMDETGAVCSVGRVVISPSLVTTMMLQPDGRVIYDLRPLDMRDPRPAHGGLAVVTRSEVLLPGDESDALQKADPNLTRGSTFLAPIIGYPGVLRRL
ncbi:MAG: trypsin-like peptidase domain-containing protein, partial [Verrucomicrobium sp.]